MTKRVILRARQARPFYGRHPWVFAGAIDSVAGEPADGDEVELLTQKGEFLARGLFNSQSKIRVRLYSWLRDQALDEEFFRERLQTAIRLRERLGLNQPREACRLVNSEGDGLSGLVVDRFGSWLTVQFTSLALALRRAMFANVLSELIPSDGIYLRTERGISHLEGLELRDGPLRGSVPNGSTTIEEHGLIFHVNLAEGQKTGFYLDQRDNRQAVAKLAAGRRVLDAFCYSGGFGIHTAKAGATHVIGIDQSEPALDLARANALANGLQDRMNFVHADAFEDLQERIANGDSYGLIILDPPKFAQARDAVEDALRAYRRLQALAVRLLEPDGLLVTCCCSGLVTAGMLLEVLAQVAAEARCEVQLIEVRGAASDHPISVSCLESQYLKCVVACVR